MTLIDICYHGFQVFLKEKIVFFCSELIAETLSDKSLGILPGNIPNYKYSPGMFADNNLIVSDGYKYDNCKFVDFSELK